MTVAVLPTRPASQWSAAEDALLAALPVADHPLMTQHADMARRLQQEAGRPTMVWANRIAAIAVIAERRADTAPTIPRRAAYIDVAIAASGLLLLADLLHDVRPDEHALRVIAGLGPVDRSALA